MDITLHDKVGQ